MTASASPSRASDARKLPERSELGGKAYGAGKRVILYVDNDAKTFLLYRTHLARAAMEAGFRVHVATPSSSWVHKLEDAGFQHHAVPITRKGINPVTELRCVLALHRLYQRLKPDIIHHLRVKPTLYGGIAARYCGVEAQVNMLTGLGYVFTSADLEALCLRPLVRAGLRLAFGSSNQRVVFENPENRDYLVSAGVVPEKRTRLVPGSGVNASEFRPTPAPGGVPLCAMPCRMLWDKGVGEFVAAARILRNRGIQVRMALIGDTDPGNPSAVPVAQLREWRDSGVIEWWGYRPDMPAVIGECSFVCLPTSYAEGVPTVLMEAAAAGRAIVASDSPGCREVVRHGQNGLRVPIHQPGLLADAIQLLATNPELCAKFGNKSRAIAVADFSWEHVISLTLEIYSELLRPRLAG